MFVARREYERALGLLEGYRAEDETPALRREDAPLRDDVFYYAGLSNAEKRACRSLCAVAVGAACLLFAVTRLPVILVLAPAMYLLYRGALAHLVFRRAEEFERDYAPFLISLASSIKTGRDPMAALAKSSDYFREGSVIRAELERVNRNIEHGMSEEDVVGRFARSVKHPDIALFRTAFILARKEGSSIAACLERLASVTRQRQSFRRKIRGAVAMQRLSALGIAGCFAAIAIFQATTNREALRLAMEAPVGQKLMLLAAGLIAGGVGWMFQMSKQRI